MEQAGPARTWRGSVRTLLTAGGLRLQVPKTGTGGAGGSGLHSGIPDADDLLRARQSRLVEADLRLKHLQIKNESVTLVLKQLTALVGLFVAAGLIVMIASAAGAKRAVVESFDAPPTLTDRGLSGNVIAAGLQDALTTIQGAVRTTAQRHSIDNAWTGDIAVQVPQTGISVGEIDRILRHSLGSETYVSGSLTENEDGSVALTVRGTGIAPKTFTGQRADLPALTTAAAEYVYGLYEPRLFALYLYQNKRYAEGEAFVVDAFARESDDVRPELLMYWGLMLSQQQRYAESVNKQRLSVTQDPTVWRAWNSLVSGTRRTQGEEAAWRVGQELTGAAAAAPDDDQPTALGWYNYQLLVQDWTGQIENLEEDAIRTGGGGSFGVLSATLLADAETRRHDWIQARKYLDMADPNDPALVPARLLLAGYRAIDLGNPQAAIAPLEQFHQLWLGSEAFQFQFDYGPCHLALAYGLTGQAEKAAPLLADFPGSTFCQAYAADIIAAAGDRRAADAAYRRAAAIAPSLPFAYQRWGLALQRRGDHTRAYAMFEKARRQGPRWADPLKSQGDILAAAGRWAEARDKYAEALALAPGWQELRQSLRQARTKAPPKSWPFNLFT